MPDARADSRTRCALGVSKLNSLKGEINAKRVTIRGKRKRPPGVAAARRDGRGKKRREEKISERR